MTTYNDIPQIDKLYTEQQLIKSAIYNLENGGSIINMSVAPSSTPPPPSEGSPLPMTVIVNLSKPNPDELIVDALEALKARNLAITQELASLGIVWPKT